MDAKVFYDTLRRNWGKFGQEQIDGINFLLTSAETLLERSNSLRKLAYILATVKHETANRFQPIPEMGGQSYLSRKPYYPYYGRGYVQLTWKRNYEFVGKQLNVDLVTYPDKALDKDIAVIVLFRGIQEAWFGPKTLEQFMGTESYEDDRQTVNLMDKAKLIAEYAKVFEKALIASGWELKAAKEQEPSLIDKIIAWIWRY